MMSIFSDLLKFRDLLSLNLNAARKTKKSRKTERSSSDDELSSFESPLKRHRMLSSEEERTEDDSYSSSPSMYRHHLHLESAISTAASSPERQQMKNSRQLKNNVSKCNDDDDYGDTSFDERRKSSSYLAVEELSQEVGKISLQDTQIVLNQFFQRPKSKFSILLRHSPLHQQVLLFSVCKAARQMKGEKIGQPVDLTLIQVRSLNLFEVLLFDFSLIFE